VLEIAADGAAEIQRNVPEREIFFMQLKYLLPHLGIEAPEISS